MDTSTTTSLVQTNTENKSIHTLHQQNPKFQNKSENTSIQPITKITHKTHQNFNYNFISSNKH